jgi:hypothetical protein
LIDKPGNCRALRKHRQAYLGFRPSSRAATARRSFLGERRPLSRAVGTGEFYVSFAPRTCVCLRRVCRRSMRRALLRAATRVLRLQRCKRESAPAIGRTGAPLVLRVAEPELAREPRTPGAERQGSSAQARRLHELRSEFRFTSLAKKIRMTLAVIPQMRLRKHGSLPSTSRTRSRAVVFLTVPSRSHPSRQSGRGSVL